MEKLNLILAQLREFYGTEKTLVVSFPNSNKNERAPILDDAQVGTTDCRPAFSLSFWRRLWGCIVALSVAMPNHLKMYWETNLQGQPDCGLKVSEYE